MVTTDYIQKIIDKNKKIIHKCIKYGKYEDALLLISISANILYNTNIYYLDDDLENSIKIIADKLSLNTNSPIDFESDEECILFYDGFGLNDRGLIQIYLNALCKVKRVIYVAFYDRKNMIPDVQKILNEYNCECRYICRRNKTVIEQIEQLNEYMKKYKPKRFFFYSVPDDVIATPVMSAYEGLVLRYQINLTDHAFWLGAGFIDNCIEFRNYGAKISYEYRKIEKDKIRIVPFYPVLHRDKEFQGFPFEKREDQKVMFSGGALYKTLGGDNKYYIIIDHILDKYSNLIFWYAGDGDRTEIDKIINKYPERAFLTSERSDLLQVLEHSDVYLSTYPLCGGLMFQYAAIAGCVPVTLKSGNISDDFLINQEKIGVEFWDIKDLYSEIDKLLTDDIYSESRSELMKKSVTNTQVFEEEVSKLIEGKESDLFPAKFDHIDTKKFRNWYIERLSKSDIDAMFVRRNSVKLGIRFFPLSFLKGGVHIVKVNMLKLLSDMSTY
ncbi:hypothetical protein [Butyrivibrio fibrisolvens]|uniref:hypothetical protein n=1 Tax=Butyrivibrio fibrisolvens TaxID=831 RepID=UPI0003B66322|nr:hypothetical protein [Butyrivibrio fibrisolvens]